MKKTRDEKVRELIGVTGASEEDVIRALTKTDWELKAAYDYLKDKKKPKEKKVFQVGDSVICIDNKPGKNMPEDCAIFLNTYKYFIVKDVNEKLNIDIGYKLENGNPYYFLPNRFELKEGKAPVKIIGGEATPEPEKVEVKPDDLEAAIRSVTGEKPQAQPVIVKKLSRFEEMKKKLAEKQKEEEHKERIKKIALKSDSDEEWDFELMK